ncbi:LysR family transcriptional regulator, partial [Mycolicibacterium porcinum]|uniref:LysR family transcriptional regulator n=1 Tax=Mycolicibacterium porcinum TaxID=39693 RepID=UPI003D9BBA7D
MAANIPDIRRLRQFIAIGDAGSLTNAAASLHVSQQALSSSMQQLEKELNATLFRREGRRLTLTPAGELLLAEGRTLLAAARTVAERVERTAGGGGGGGGGGGPPPPPPPRGAAPRAPAPPPPAAGGAGRNSRATRHTKP